jgi:hypothetical protein
VDILAAADFEYAFDPALRDLPYLDDSEYHADILRAVSRGLFALLEAVRGGAVFAGLPADSDEMEERLAHYSPTPPEPPQEVKKWLENAGDVIASRRKASAERGIPLRLEKLRGLFALTDFEHFCLSCALACELDRGVEQAFLTLHGREDFPCPTLGAVIALWQLWHDGEPDIGGLSDASSPVSLLLRDAPASPLYLAPLALRRQVLCWLLGERWRSRALASCAEELSPLREGEAAMFLDHAIATGGAVLDGEGSRLCVLSGRPGSGRRLTLRALTGGDRRFLLVRLEEIDPRDDITVEVLTIALLEGVTPCFEVSNPMGDARLERVLAAFAPYHLAVFLLTAGLTANFLPRGYRVNRVDYDYPGTAEAAQLWDAFLGATGAAGLAGERLAAKYILTPGQMRAALDDAADEAALRGCEIDYARLAGAVLRTGTARLHNVADRVEAFYTWDDLVLNSASERLLREVCDRVKYRHLVETAWGFGKKSAYGKGVSVLLYGPPGTGKTMCAQVIASEVGLPLYRVNIARITSKYIGETAKNFDAVFTEAKMGNVILFFDEADALFAKRTDVKSSNDRHANSESGYLLQKIEEYQGLCILATNLAANFDEAFRRRIGYIVNVNMPYPEERLRLWKGCIPPEAPLAADVDFPLLAEQLEFTGSTIKSAVMAAAYLAAADGGEIGMEHLVRAARQELAKQGKSEPHAFSAWGR